MHRKERTRILVESPNELCEILCKEIEQLYPVNIIENPHNGLVMLKTRENSKRSLFYLGEVLVTECKVEINGTIGMGIITCNDERKAYCLAVIDAAYNNKLPETMLWKKQLRDAAQQLQQQNTLDNHRIMQTKVSFETMDK